MDELYLLSAKKNASRSLIIHSPLAEAERPALREGGRQVQKLLQKTILQKITTVPVSCRARRVRRRRRRCGGERPQ
eukprot:297964-Pleurochrysis_carterae.AAC.1